MISKASNTLVKILFLFSIAFEIFANFIFTLAINNWSITNSVFGYSFFVFPFFSVFLSYFIFNYLIYFFNKEMITVDKSLVNIKYTFGFYKSIDILLKDIKEINLIDWFKFNRNDSLEMQNRNGIINYTNVQLYNRKSKIRIKTNTDEIWIGNKLNIVEADELVNNIKYLTNASS